VAVMSAEERRRTWAHLMREWDRALGGIPVNKVDLRAAVDAADQWADDNAASFNTALPQPFKGAASIGMKSLLLCYVIMRRAGRLRVDEDGP
jgi:hypothetical protein